MFAKLLLLVAPLLVPAFLSVALITPDAGAGTARSHDSVRPAVAVSVAQPEPEPVAASRDVKSGKARGSCTERKSSAPVTRQAA
jgi:hypothetical protein